MEKLIVFCETNGCGSIFEDPGVFGIKSGSIKFENIKIGPCPNCGGKGIVPNGVYEFVENNLEIIKSEFISLDNLKMIRKLLDEIKFKDDSKDSIVQKIHAISPELGVTIGKLPINNWNQWINTLIAFITLAILIQQNYFKDKPDEDLKNQFIEHLLHENQECIKISKTENTNISISNNIVINKTTTVNKPKIERNDPCYCGSGKKYKKCHLKK